MQPHTQVELPQPGAQTLMQTDLGAASAPVSPSPTLAHTYRVLLGPPGEGAPQGRLGIELGLESPAFHLLPAEPTAQVRWSPAPDPPPIQGAISMPKGRHQLRWLSLTGQTPTSGGWDPYPVEGELA